MKKTSYRLTISAPCHESWENMTETEKGRLCACCAKQVIDFTTLSDAEILNVIAGGSGKLCGRFHSMQLNRVLVPSYEKRPALSKMLAGVILLSSVSTAVSKNSSATVEVVPIANTSTKTPVLDSLQLNIFAMRDGLKICFRGTLLDLKTHEAVPFTNILLKQTGSRVTTNTDGEFTIIIPDVTLQGDTVTFQSGYPGYVPLEISFHMQDLYIREPKKEPQPTISRDDYYNMGVLDIQPVPDKEIRRGKIKR